MYLLLVIVLSFTLIFQFAYCQMFLLLFHCFLIQLFIWGYLFTVTAYKSEVTAAILITNILLLWRVQFVGFQGEHKWKKLGKQCCAGMAIILHRLVFILGEGGNCGVLKKSCTVSFLKNKSHSEKSCHEVKRWCVFSFLGFSPKVKGSEIHNLTCDNGVSPNI